MCDSSGRCRFWSNCLPWTAQNSSKNGMTQASKHQDCKPDAGSCARHYPASGQHQKQPISEADTMASNTVRYNPNPHVKLVKHPKSTKTHRMRSPRAVGRSSVVFCCGLGSVIWRTPPVDKGPYVAVDFLRKFPVDSALNRLPSFDTWPWVKIQIVPAVSIPIPIEID